MVFAGTSKETICEILLSSLGVVVLFFAILAKRNFQDVKKLWDEYKEYIIGTGLFITMLITGFILCSDQTEIFEKYDSLQYTNKEEQIVTFTGQVKSIIYNNYRYELQIETEDGIIITYMDNAGGIKYGSHISVTGNIVKMSEADNLGNYDERSYLHSKGIILKIEADGCGLIGNKNDFSQLEEILSKLSRNFEKTLGEICSDKERGIISAIVLGQTNDIEGDVKELFSISGISHILAISGLHISVIGMGIYKFLRMRLRYASSAFFSGAVMLLFLVMTGSSVSAVRAVIMFIIHVIGDVLGRKYDILSAVSLAGVCLLIKNPYYLLNASFQLSFGAMIAVGVTVPIVVEFIKVKNKIAQGFIFNVSLTFTMMPINCQLFFRLSTYAPVLNILVVPLMSYVLLMSIVGMIAGGFSSIAGEFFIGSAVYILRLYESLSEMVSKLPYNSVVTGTMGLKRIVLYYFIMIILLVIMAVRKYKGVRDIIIILMFLAPMAILVYSSKTDGFQIYFLDVGQGDSAYIHSASGHDYLIDCGSSDEKNVGRYKLESFLEYMDVDTLEYVFVTHSDSDHVSGILELIERGYIKIEYLVLPKLDEALEDDNYKEIKAAAEKQGIDIMYFSRGKSIEDGLLKLSCISPGAAEHYDDINDSSLVLTVRYKNIGVLFTGDISETVEKQLLEEAKTFKEELTDINSEDTMTILKVAHHGSKYSNCEEILDALKPDVAVISCGEDNQYGHPHRETLERLENCGSKIFDTSQMGQITVEILKGDNTGAKFRVRGINMP